MRQTFLFLLFAVLTPAAAYAIDCSSPPAPQVNLDRVSDPVHYDFTQNRQSLNQKGAQILAAHRVGSNSYVGGLTDGSIASNMSTQLQTLTSTDGSACVWITQVNIQLHYQPTVYVSREFVPGSCYHTAVLEHEHKHVAMDLALMDAFAPQLQQSILAVVQAQGHMGPIAKSQLQDATHVIQNAMNAKLNEMIDGFSKLREARQAQIDVPSEYARVQSLCRNWP